MMLLDILLDNQIIQKIRMPITKLIIVHVSDNYVHDSSNRVTFEIYLKRFLTH